MKKINWEILALTRFILAAIVIVNHLTDYTDVGCLNWFKKLGAFEAILGFLLISGFSIGKSIQRNKENYFLRRIKRIYPVYLASILFLVGVAGLKTDFSSIIYFIFNLLFLNHIFTATSFVGPAWTLATEVWLYTLAPFFLKLSQKALIGIIAGSFAAFAIYTAGRTLYHWPYFSGTSYGINLILLAFIWVAGFVLATHPESKSITKIIALLFVGHIVLSFAIQGAYRIKHNEIQLLINTDLPEYILKSICLLFSYIVVVRNNTIKEPGHVANRVFNFLGNISYPLYLTHITSYELMVKYFHINNRFALILASILISSIVYYIFDFYTKKRTVA
ncbi:acyltransferase family protein [Flavobacterium sp. RNTU_13]|uniref:acyltransferase family protein n=1 Tax=Flavobacterium sp. RNTU_13 TaxID=3375145 RepID=UPI00398840E7